MLQVKLNTKKELLNDIKNIEECYIETINRNKIVINDYKIELGLL